MKLPNLRKSLSRDAIFALFILFVSISLVLLPPLYESPYAQTVDRVRAEVLAADDSLVKQFGIVKSGSQTLQVKILEGQFAGQIVTASNHLLGKMETDKMFKPGDTAFLVLNIELGERILAATAYDHYRLDVELWIVLLFAALLIAFAGWSGARALLSFVFALLLIWKILLPTILLGWDPILVALVVVTTLIGVTAFLVAGISRVAVVAFIGSLLGVLLTMTLAMFLVPAFNLHGAIQPFSETLLYTGHASLELVRLFLAAIFIGASGAVLDVAIDVSTAMNEVAEKRPDLSRRELARSGFVVGRNMTSTMVTTLLMAYVSGYIALLMVFLSQGVPPINILNTNYVAAEILRTVVGSFGLVTVAPFTAIVGGFVYAQKIHHPQETVVSPALPLVSD